MVKRETGILEILFIQIQETDASQSSIE